MFISLGQYNSVFMYYRCFTYTRCLICTSFLFCKYLKSWYENYSLFLVLTLYCSCVLFHLNFFNHEAYHSRFFVMIGGEQYVYLMKLSFVAYNESLYYSFTVKIFPLLSGMKKCQFFTFTVDLIDINTGHI